jgi:hypothetical protein
VVDSTVYHQPEQELEYLFGDGGVKLTWHLSQPTDSRTDTKSTFPAELNSDKTEWLVSRRNKCEFRSSKDKWWKCSELRFRVNASRIFLHHNIKLQCRELTVQIDDGSDTNELNIFVLLENSGKAISDEIETLLVRPAPNEDEEFSFRVDVQFSPF